MVERAQPDLRQVADRAPWHRRQWAFSRAGSRLLSLLALLVSDTAALALALALAVMLRVTLLPGVSHAFYRSLYPISHYAGLWWLPLLYGAALAHAGLYTRRDPYWEETRRCLGGATVAAILAMAALSLSKTADAVSRPIVVLSWAALLVLLPLGRALTKEALFAAGIWRKPALLVGDPAVAGPLVETFRRHPTLGYDAVEIVSDPAIAPERAAMLGAREVILAAPRLARADFLHLVERLRAVAENILIVPDLTEAPVVGVEVLGLMEDRTLLLRVPNNLLKPWNLALKRAFDILVGGVLLAAALPVIAVLALAVKLDSPGPAVHMEPRVGRRRGLFTCYKLRTMHECAPQLLDAYLLDHPEAAAEWARYRKLRAFDPRVTRLGRVLRRYSLDELPQLLNVVRGEMSLVGPRPYLPSEMALVDDDGMCDVRPGMTGLWQVSGKNALALTERVRLERWYVNNWSLWLDLIVLLKTPAALLRAPLNAPGAA